MSSISRTVGLAAAVALLAAACGAATGSTSPGASSTFPNVSPSGGVGGASGTPGLSASTGDLTTGGSTGGSAGSTGDLTTGGSTGGAASSPMTGEQLVGTIPTRIADMTLTVKTATPADLPLFDSATGATLLTTLTSALGVDASQLTAALGTSTDGKLTIGALQVPGADVAKLTSTLGTAFSSLGAKSDVQLGGRSVTSVDLQGATVYMYATGSTIYLVKAPDELVGEEALVALPGTMTP